MYRWLKVIVRGLQNVNASMPLVKTFRNIKGLKKVLSGCLRQKNFLPGAQIFLLTCSKGKGSGNFFF